MEIMAFMRGPTDLRGRRFHWGRRIPDTDLAASTNRVPPEPGPEAGLRTGPNQPSSTVIVFWLSAVLTALAPAAPQNSVTVRYVANEGVLIASDSAKVLIDGLHRPYRPAYATLDQEGRRLAESADGPFAGIDLILVSHRHGDHFSAEAVAAHLQSSSRAAFAGAPQMTTPVLAVGVDSNRVTTLPLRPGQRRTVTGPGYRVEVIGIMHGGRTWEDVENLGHLIEVGGKRFLHIGDADTEPRHYEALGLATREIDVAFIPFWFLQSDEGRDVVDRLINAKQVIAVHVSPGEGDRVRRAIRPFYPEAAVFDRPMEDGVVLQP